MTLVSFTSPASTVAVKKKKSAKERAARGRASARAVAAKKIPSGKRVYDD